MKKAFTVAAVIGLVGCGFDDLERAPDPGPEATDDLEGAVEINGIQILPAIIHPGDEVTLHDPVRPSPGQPATVYLWDACGGTIQGADFARDTTWLAPDEPGLYAVTVNLANTQRDDPSRVLPLCVVDESEACPSEPAEAPVLDSVAADPSSFDQTLDCGGSCRTTVEAVVTIPDASEPMYRWRTRGGEIEGAGPVVLWLLPTVGCCTESFITAVTVCGAPGAAATGFTNAVVAPGG